MTLQNSINKAVWYSVQHPVWYSVKGSVWNSVQISVSDSVRGSVEVDDYYWNNVEESIQTISHLIDDTDWATERLFYQSSW